jgi:uridine phosphorylase
MTERVPNLKIVLGELPERVIVCGDPNRAARIAGLLQNAKNIAENREYHSYAGSWNGVEVAIVSHGVGAPGAAVCFEELVKAGAKTIIRVGTAGSYQKDVIPGSLVISSSSVRKDGLTSQLVPEGFPAVADRKVTENLAATAAAASTGLPVHEGMTLTLDAFYPGVIAFPHQLFKKAGVVAVEMENSALFVIASLRGIRSGAILSIDGYADADFHEEYNPHTDSVAQAVEASARIALDAICAD